MRRRTNQRQTRGWRGGVAKALLGLAATGGALSQGTALADNFHDYPAPYPDHFHPDHFHPGHPHSGHPHPGHGGPGMYPPASQRMLERSPWAGYASELQCGHGAPRTQDCGHSGRSHLQLCDVVMPLRGIAHGLATRLDRLFEPFPTRPCDDACDAATLQQLQLVPPPPAARPFAGRPALQVFPGGPPAPMPQPYPGTGPRGAPTPPQAAPVPARRDGADDPFADDPYQARRNPAISPTAYFE